MIKACVSLLHLGVIPGNRTEGWRGDKERTRRQASTKMHLHGLIGPQSWVTSSHKKRVSESSVWGKKGETIYPWVPVPSGSRDTLQGIWTPLHFRVEHFGGTEQLYECTMLCVQHAQGSKWEVHTQVWGKVLPGTGTFRKPVSQGGLTGTAAVIEARGEARISEHALLLCA